MNSLSIGILKRNLLVFLYLIWIAIGISIFVTPINAFYQVLAFLGWCAIGLLVLVGTIFYRFTGSKWKWLIRACNLLIILPAIFMATFWVGANITEVRHQQALDHFLKEVKQSGQLPDGYALSVTKPSELTTLQPVITDTYSVEMIDYFFGTYSFRIQFQGQKARIIFDIRKSEEGLWDLSF